MPSEQFDAILALLAATPASPDASPDELRTAIDALAALVPPPAGTITTMVDAGGVPAMWVAADDEAMLDDGTAPVVLHFHGGGYAFAGSATHVAMNARIASGIGGRVLSVDYRLAPEHRCPAAAEDAWRSYGWLQEQGIDADRIVVAGDSAGGGLALNVLIAARDRGLAQPAGAALLSPWVDLTSSGETITTRAAVDPMLSPELLARWAGWYAGDDVADRVASPLFADLGGLAPMLIQVGDREILLDDAIRLVEQVVAAGGRASLAAWAEMTHWWQLFAGLVPEADRALDEASAWIVEQVRTPLR